MLIYCARRLLLALLLVWAVASAAFVLTRLAPGDDVDGAVLVSEAERLEARRRAGLDRPLGVQYLQWVGGALRLDFGESRIYAGLPVASLVGTRAANTAILAVAAMLLATLLGMGAGWYTGTHDHGPGPTIVRALSTICLSVPPLVGVLVLVLLAARTGWLPVGGMTSSAVLTGGAWLLDVLRHLPVPAVALALPLAATLERVQSQALAEARQAPHVRAALARGVSSSEALRRHAWPASLGPVFGIYGLMVGSLLSGSLVVEVVTAWPGLGRLLFDALRGRDLYLAAGAAAAGGAGLALATWITDVVHALVDPRVRGAR